ncbi:MAG: hypothetical protein WC789_14470 [Lentisphaeria bacterium]
MDRQTATVNVLGGNAQARVIVDVLIERERQDAKWGVQRHAPAVWMLILGEEVGEAAEDPFDDVSVQAVVSPMADLVKACQRCREILEAGYGRTLDANGSTMIAPARVRYRAELVQVAAVAVAAIESLDATEVSHA